MKKHLGAMLAVAAGVLMLPAAASATFHLNKIQQVSGGHNGQFDGYIVLQAAGAGENFVGGHDITIYDAVGAQIAGSPITLTHDVSNGKNNAKILIGDSNVVGRDFTANLGMIQPGGDPQGAICFDTVDCVSWGGAGFTGNAQLPSSAGTPFPTSLPGPTQALTRKINRGCKTFLELSDDTNNSASDFGVTARSPQNNASKIANKLCVKKKKVKCSKKKHKKSNSPYAADAKKHKKSKCGKKKHKK